MALKEYEINFLAETHLEDVITLQGLELKTGPKEREVLYQGLREKDLKPVFTARLRAEPWI